MSTQLTGFAPWKPTSKSLVTLDQIIALIEGPLVDVLPVMARQVWYAMIANHAYPKTERSYKNLCALLTRARRAGYIDFDDIRDDGQSLAIVSFANGLADQINLAERFHRGAGYNLDLQKGQKVRLIVWSETAGMVPQLARVAHKYGVDVVSGGGQPSVTFNYEIAQMLDAQCSQGGNGYALILQIGDHDPSGLDMVRSVGDDIDAFSEHGVDIERIAVTEAQIKKFDLATAPKKATDTKGKRFCGVNGDGFSTVQCEAIPPTELAYILQAAIERHQDSTVVASVKEQRAADVERLNILADEIDWKSEEAFKL